MSFNSELLTLNTAGCCPGRHKLSMDRHLMNLNCCDSHTSPFEEILRRKSLLEASYVVACLDVETLCWSLFVPPLQCRL